MTKLFSALGGKQKFAATALLCLIILSLVIPIRQARAIPVAVVADPFTAALGVIEETEYAIENPREFFRTAKDIVTSIASIGSWISDKITASGMSALVIKEYVLDPIANIIAKAIIRAVTNTVVSWIQGGGSPMFVQDVGKEFAKAADEAGGSYLNKLAQTNLCSGFGINFRFNLTLPRVNRLPQCTVSGIIAALKGTTFNKELSISYDDFESGGIEQGIRRYASLLDPDNTYTGAFDKAYHQKTSLEVTAGGKKIKVFDWSSGFKPFEWKEDVEEEHCEPGADGRAICDKVKVSKIRTPGKVVAETLQKSIDVGLDVGAVADELDEAIITIINALINRVVNGSIQGSSGGGLTDEGSGSIPFEEPRITVNVLDQKVDDITMRIAATQLILYKNLVGLNGQLAEIGEKITKLNEEKLKLTKEKQDCEANPFTCEPDRLNQILERLKQIDEEIKNLESQKANTEKEKREGRLPTDGNYDVIPGPIPILEKLNGLLDRALNLKSRSMDTTDTGEISDLNKKATALEQELGELIFNVSNAPNPGQSGTKTEDNWIEVINKITDRTELVIVQVNKKISAEKDLGLKAKLVQLKTDLQKLANDLKNIKTKITSANADFEEIKKLILESIPKIKALSQKLAEAFNL